jgi:hypothetical protein
MTHRRHVLLLMSVLCCLLLAAPGQAKDLCCIVNCGQIQKCHHWNTFMVWADTKCSALGFLASCGGPNGGEAQVQAGTCRGQSICTDQNTVDSPATKGRGEKCKKDTDCDGSTRCAKFAIRRDRCVVPCEVDSDCSGGEKCKQPVGADFKFCK